VVPLGGVGGGLRLPLGGGGGAEASEEEDAVASDEDAGEGAM